MSNDGRRPTRRRIYLRNPPQLLEPTPHVHARRDFRRLYSRRHQPVFPPPSNPVVNCKPLLSRELCEGPLCPTSEWWYIAPELDGVIIVHRLHQLTLRPHLMPAHAQTRRRCARRQFTKHRPRIGRHGKRLFMFHGHGPHVAHELVDLTAIPPGPAKIHAQSTPEANLKIAPELLALHRRVHHELPHSSRH